MDEKHKEHDDKDKCKDHGLVLKIAVSREKSSIAMNGHPDSINLALMIVAIENIKAEIMQQHKKHAVILEQSNFGDDKSEK